MSEQFKNPYPGLRPFSADEKHLFTGRADDTNILNDKILTQRLTLLFAASGVGKSSLLQAAVIPKLQSPMLGGVKVVYYRDWVVNPLETLSQQILASLDAEYADFSLTPQPSLNELLAYVTLFTPHPFVIVLDQFEEFFRYQRKDSESFERFVKQLSDVIHQDEIPVNIVLSMREDFALELNVFKQYLPRTLFENFYRLERLGKEAGEKAILHPVKQLGYQYEKKLLDKIVQDLLREEWDRQAESLADERIPVQSIAPPYLQIICSQLWQLSDHSQDEIKLETYEKEGGATGFVKRYIDRVLDQFSIRERDIASVAFEHLIVGQGAKQAYQVDELAKKTKVKKEQLLQVLDKLAGESGRHRKSLRHFLDTFHQWLRKNKGENNKPHNPNEINRILFKKIRNQEVWFELYHDVLSKSLNEWNTRWKRIILMRSLMKIGMGVLMAAALLFVVYDTTINATQQYLRTNPVTAQIELYQGSAWPFSIDLFNQKKFLQETRFSSKDLQPNQYFKEEPIYSEGVQIQLAKKLAPIDTMRAYFEVGEVELALELENQTDDNYKYKKEMIDALEIIPSLKSLDRIKFQNNYGFMYLGFFYHENLDQKIPDFERYLVFTKNFSLVKKFITGNGFDERVAAIFKVGKLTFFSDELTPVLFESINSEYPTLKIAILTTLHSFGVDDQLIFNHLSSLDNIEGYIIQSNFLKLVDQVDVPDFEKAKILDKLANKNLKDHSSVVNLYLSLDIPSENKTNFILSLLNLGFKDYQDLIYEVAGSNLPKSEIKKILKLILSNNEGDGLFYIVLGAFDEEFFPNDMLDDVFDDPLGFLSKKSKSSFYYIEGLKFLIKSKRLSNEYKIELIFSQIPSFHPLIDDKFIGYLDYISISDECKLNFIFDYASRNNFNVGGAVVGMISKLKGDRVKKDFLDKLTNNEDAFYKILDSMNISIEEKYEIIKSIGSDNFLLVERRFMAINSIYAISENDKREIIFSMIGNRINPNNWNFNPYFSLVRKMSLSQVRVFLPLLKKTEGYKDFDLRALWEYSSNPMMKELVFLKDYYFLSERIPEDACFFSGVDFKYNKVYEEISKFKPDYGCRISVALDKKNNSNSVVSGVNENITVNNKRTIYQASAVSLKHAIQYLKDPQYIVRQQAIFGVSHHGNTKAVKQLTEAWLNADTEITQFSVFQAIDGVLLQMQYFANRAEWDKLKAYYSELKETINNSDTQKIVVHHTSWNNSESPTSYTQKQQAMIKKSLIPRIEYTLKQLEWAYEAWGNVREHAKAGMPRLMKRYGIEYSQEESDRDFAGDFDRPPYENRYQLADPKEAQP